MPRDRTYKVLCVSMYLEDARELDRKVELLRRRGFPRMSRSRLLRIAMKRLDLEKIIPGDSE